MKRIFYLTAVLAFILSASTCSFAQGGKKRKGEPSKTMTEAEKKIVIDIFRKFNPASYYLELSRGNEVFGTRDIVTQEQLIAIREKQFPAGTENYTIGSYHYEMGMVFIIKTRARAELGEIFGKTDASRLQAIINKYTEDYLMIMGVSSN